nr:segregation/condensation protein A [Peristeroidobacter soli]
MSKAKPELKLVEDTGSQLQDEDLSAELPPQQSEMPFAVVEGEPMTQLPRDLYIPPDALQVFLTAFEGPLDLLLYLIRKQNLDILNIPIAEITRQYMKYIEVMAELQLELAGEYLLMAAMLAEIKSRMLLPRPPSAEGTDEDDPRAELVRRLQEYERFKKAAEDLDKLNRLERDNVLASAELEERQVVKLLPDVTLKEMLDAFRDVLSRAEKFAHHHISRERLSQRERMTEILARLQTVAFFEFRQLFKPEEGRMGVTVTFIAILELMKEGLIEIVQAEAYAPIHVRTAQRHLKVVQGGVAASETADAENAAALAQPELAGENDIPDDDDTPPADDAAIAVQEAVADVAAASSIAVDSIESDNTIVDAGFVEAAVSEAIASTENAVETVAEVAATDEAAVAAAVAEEVAAGSPVVIDEAALESSEGREVAIDAAVIEAAAADLAAEDSLPAEPGAVDVATDGSLLIESAGADIAIEGLLIEPATLQVVTDELSVNSHVYDEVTLEDVPHDFGAVDSALADETDPLTAQAVEQVAELSVSPVMDVLAEGELTQAGLIEGTVADAPESVEALVSIYTPEPVETTEAVEPNEAAGLAETTEAVDVTEVVGLTETTEAVEPNEVVGLTETTEAVESTEVIGLTEMTEAVEPNEAVAAIESVDVVPGDERTVEEHVVEEHEVEEHIVPEHVVEEHVVPTPVVIEENTSQTDAAAFVDESVARSEAEVVVDQVEAADGVDGVVDQVETAEVLDEVVDEVEAAEAVDGVVDEVEAADGVDGVVDQVETAEVLGGVVDEVETADVVDEVVSRAEPVEITDEVVASSDFTTAEVVEEEVVDEHSQPVETTDVVMTEAAPAVEAVEVAAAVEDAPADETIEVAAGQVPAEETTNVVIEDAPAPVTADAAGHDEATTEQTADLSGPDLSNAGDSVTGASDEADNTDAEPTR